MTFQRSLCPLANTLDILGDKWTLLIIRDLFSGKHHFKDFMSSPEKISTNILSNRLTRLLKYELIELYASPEVAGKNAYQLSLKGQSLYPLLESVSNWGLANIPGTRKIIQLDTIE